MEKEYKLLLSLAKKISNSFPAFYLAGGTALMLKHKHRVSVDLDFFNQKSFSYSRLSTKVRENFIVEAEEKFEDNIDFFIDKIKISFVFFPFKNILPLENLNGISIASDYDIFLNKIYVAGRRIDPKDPYDAAFLYKKYKWDKAKIKNDFQLKFPNQSYEIFLGALLNFDDYPKLNKWIKQELLHLINF
jgi:predicted nucleotidyltransferase component of viral defense system